MASNFGLERQSLVGEMKLVSAFGLAAGKNLLPNASSELGGHFQFDGYWQRICRQTPAIRHL